MVRMQAVLRETDSFFTVDWRHVFGARCPLLTIHALIRGRRSMLKLAGLVVVSLLVVGQETPSDDSLAYQELKSMEVFVGTWKANATLPGNLPGSKQLGEMAGKKAQIVITNRWAPGKCALIEEFSYTIEGVATIEGVSIRAWDQEKEHIGSHSFTSHKGTWAGKWRKEGNTWIHEFKGMNLDREEVIGKWEVVFQDEDHYTLKETRTANGEPRPSITWKYHRLK